MDAFGSGPLRFRPSHDEAFLLGIQGVIVGGEGNFLATSGNGPEGDRAVGWMGSPEFVIDGSELRLRVAGGESPSTRVELRVDGKVHQIASGHAPSYMEEVVWDVRADIGRRARLRIVDADVAQHILVDHVRLMDSDGLKAWCK